MDRCCARWPDKSAVGAEEYLWRGRTKEWESSGKIRKRLHCGLRLENEGEIISSAAAIPPPQAPVAPRPTFDSRTRHPSWA